MNTEQICIKLESRDIETLKMLAEKEYATPGAMARAILLRTLRKHNIEQSSH